MHAPIVTCMWSFAKSELAWNCRAAVITVVTTVLVRVSVSLALPAATVLCCGASGKLAQQRPSERFRAKRWAIVCPPIVLIR